jgi:hypothetical protein
LIADSVSEKHNITWAGQVSFFSWVDKDRAHFFFSQTFGGSFESDGRLQGTLDVQTVNCDSSSNTCQIQVPAPGFALAILTQQQQDGGAPATSTFSTSAVTKWHNTATVNPSVLATSNGHSGSDFHLGSTSPQKYSSSGGRREKDVSFMEMVVVLGIMMFWNLGLGIV